MIRRPPRSTQSRSSAASDVYKRQGVMAAAMDRNIGSPGDGDGLEIAAGEDADFAALRREAIDGRLNGGELGKGGEPVSHLAGTASARGCEGHDGGAAIVDGQQDLAAGVPGDFGQRDAVI